MRVANVAGRLSIIVDSNRAVDVESASGGKFAADVQAVYACWTDFVDWAHNTALPEGSVFTGTELGAPVPQPPQIFGIGLNYREHAAEAGLPLPEDPLVFTKFPSAVTGPYGEIAVPAGSVDWEVELVAVIGRLERNIAAPAAWDYVAGLTVGQDLSERDLQWAGAPPQQFNLSKSYPGFAPIGPILVTPDAFPNPDSIEISCSLSGQLMQKSRTDDMVFSIPALIEYLSGIVTLLPGDLIFTGTPSGIGFSRKPQRLITPGDILATTAELIGEMRHDFVDPV